MANAAFAEQLFGARRPMARLFVALLARTGRDGQFWLRCASRLWPLVALAHTCKDFEQALRLKQRPKSSHSLFMRRRCLSAHGSKGLEPRSPAVVQQAYAKTQTAPPKPPLTSHVEQAPKRACKRKPGGGFGSGKAWWLQRRWADMQTRVKKLEALSRLLSASRARFQPGRRQIASGSAPPAYSLPIHCLFIAYSLPIHCLFIACCLHAPPLAAASKKFASARAPVTGELLSGCRLVVSLLRFTAPVAL